jgi:hypothetical protein
MKFSIRSKYLPGGVDNGMVKLNCDSILIIWSWRGQKQDYGG